MPLLKHLLLHVAVVVAPPLALSDGRAGAQDGHLVQLEELLTQAVLQVLVQLAAGTECVVTQKKKFEQLLLRKMMTLAENGILTSRLFGGSP